MFCNAFKELDRDSDHLPKEINHTFLPREKVEIWFPSEETCRKNSHASDLDTPSGAWWPGHVLSVHDKLVHVEVAAPIQNNSSSVEPKLTTHTKLPYVPAVVSVENVRLPWSGSTSTDSINCPPSYISLDSHALLQHTMYFPEQLYKIASNPQFHRNFLMFCNAPCLINCDPEPVPLNQFLPQPENSIPVMAVRLNIWSASAEAIRRAKLLEPVHLSLLQERYRILAYLSQMKVSSNAMQSLHLATNDKHTASSVAESSSSLTNSLSLVPVPQPRVTSDGLIDAVCAFPSATKINWSDGGHAFRLMFSVEPHLMGFVIGARGCNVSAVRDIEDIYEVSVEDTRIVTVVAKTPELCQLAREMLDIIELEVPMEARFVIKLKPECHKMAQECGVKKAYFLGGLARFRIHHEKKQAEQQRLSGEEQEPISDEQLQKLFLEEEANWPPSLCIIGPRNAVFNMNHLINFHVKNWHSLTELEGTKRTLQAELRKVDGRPSERTNFNQSQNGYKRNTEGRRSSATRGNREPYKRRPNPRDRGSFGYFRSTIIYAVIEHTRPRVLSIIISTI
ncbi:hypothetical protein Ciccas_002627 [Cichlidogyrus casuarinus]|uniref:Uncharacterized protein n=1 Tax=Cichlidogyrus casuarinus TaxID=1844966 RepID=A0ABD2QGP8_9PLAT